MVKNKGLLMILFLSVILIFVCLYHQGFVYSQAEPEIKFLGTVALTGEAATVGVNYDRAIRLAIEEINEEGLEGFSRINYRTIDTETSPSALASKLHREVQRWGPHIAGGTALEPTIRVLCEASQSHKIPMFIGGYKGLSKYIPPGEVPLTDWMTYQNYTDFHAGYFAGKFFHDRGAEKVAFIGGDYDWGYGNSTGLLYYWMENDQPFEITPVQYVPTDRADLSSEVRIIKEADPDALFIVFTGDSFFSLPNQLLDADAKPETILYSVVYSNLGAAMITGEDGARDVYALSTHDPDSDSWRDYVHRWQDAYGARSYPEGYSHNYYQMVHWFRKVFEEAGTTDPEVIRETVKRVSFDGVNIGTTGPIDEYGFNMNSIASIVQFVDGSSDLAPDFGLKPVLAETFEIPSGLNSYRALEIMKEIGRLRSEESYPMN